VNANTIEGDEPSRSIYHRPTMDFDSYSISQMNKRRQNLNTTNHNPYNQFAMLSPKTEGPSVTSQGEYEY
jgi:hypothetical protein